MLAQKLLNCQPVLGGALGERTVLAKWRELCFRRHREERTDCSEKRRKEKVRINAEIKN
jgi:hypothetical protein